MTEKLDKYILDVQIDNETGEEHCTVLKTDGTTNMANWIEIVSAMYTHHSILEPLVDELNKIQNNYNNTEKYAIKLWEKNEQLKSRINDYDVALKRLQGLADNEIKKNEQLKTRLDFCNSVNKETNKQLKLVEEKNEQLKQQLNIFEKFLEENDLSIDWVEFCRLDECAFENPNFSCKDCIHLKVMWNEV